MYKIKMIGLVTLKQLKVSLAIAIMILATGITGCSSKPEPPIKLVTNAWIGYSPLFYAKEKGWLKPLNIELSTVVSLGESVMTFNIGHFDGLTSTQYEFNQLQKTHKDLVPIIMFNRSNGGDMVMSNNSLEQLKEVVTTIDVYLEINSINSDVFKNFIKTQGLEHKRFNLINKDPLKTVAEVKQMSLLQPVIIVTHNPYNFELSKHNLQVIASTTSIDDILVVDALYVGKALLIKQKNNLIKLKQVINQSLKDLQSNPHDFYLNVKPYLENGNYEDFLASLEQIEWLNSGLPDPLLNKLNQLSFPTQDLL